MYVYTNLSFDQKRGFLDDKRLIAQKERNQMERAVFGASEFFSSDAFRTSFRGIENVRVGHLKRKGLDIVEIWFNPWKVTYQELLELFFDLHDPTSKTDENAYNQSIVFFSDQNQFSLAKQKKSELAKAFKGQVVTKIAPAFEYLNDLH